MLRIKGFGDTEKTMDISLEPSKFNGDIKVMIDGIEVARFNQNKTFLFFGQSLMSPQYKGKWDE